MAKFKRDKNERVLSIRDLNISFKTNFGVVRAIRGVRLDLFQGETVAIVGESGSGKSVTVKTMMGILDSNGTIESGSINTAVSIRTGSCRNSIWPRCRRKRSVTSSAASTSPWSSRIR